MNKIAKYIFTAVLIICLVFIIYHLINPNTKDNKNQKNIENIVDEVLNSSENVLLFVGGKSCENCSYVASQFGLLLDEYNFEFYYIDTDEIKISSKREKMYENLGFKAEVAESLPIFALYKDGKIVDAEVGIITIDDINSFLIRNSIVEDKKLPLNFLDLSKFGNFREQSGLKFLAITNISSGVGIGFEEYMWNMAKEYNLDINVIITNNFTSSEYSVIENSNSFFKSNEYELPILIVYNGDQIVNYIADPISNDEYVEFLKKIDIIK